MGKSPPSYPHSLDPQGVQAFWERVRRDVNAQGCWCIGKQQLYTYGSFIYSGRSYQVHRLAYELTYGFPPLDRVLMHMCQNKWCCNPDHIQVGTRSDNAQDYWDVVKGRKRPLGQ